MDMEIEEHYVETNRHKTFYLACGPKEGDLIIMTHGWPELSLSWRHQLEYFGKRGYRAIAPDMRGYGRSTVYNDKNAYCQEEIIQDMVESLRSTIKEKAILIGHVWGSLHLRSRGASPPDPFRNPIPGNDFVDC